MNCLTLNDLRDAPPELLKELGISESEKLVLLYSEIIDAAGGVANIDQIVLGIYKRTQQIESRATVNSRLYRFKKKGWIHQHPTLKGVYGTKPFGRKRA